MNLLADSILEDVKKQLGIPREFEAFDSQVLVGINSALYTLWSLGMGENPVVVRDYTVKWNDIITEDVIALVPSHVYLYTKRQFDPPQSGVLLDNVNRQIAELEWRIRAHYDRPAKEENNG